MDTTIIEIGEHSLDYMRKTDMKVKKVKGYLIFIITAVLIFISVCFFALQVAELPFLEQLYIFRRIKNNMGNWKQLILEKTGIEISRGQSVASRVSKEAFSINCFDLGQYYVAVRLSEKNNLPEFIRRAKGDVWMMKKADKIDPSSQQFCEYVSRNMNTNTVSCGIDMYNKIGYSGYFERFHPCQTILDEILERFKI